MHPSLSPSMNWIGRMQQSKQLEVSTNSPTCGLSARDFDRFLPINYRHHGALKCVNFFNRLSKTFPELKRLKVHALNLLRMDKYHKTFFFSFHFIMSIRQLLWFLSSHLDISNTSVIMMMTSC